jgi:hypothetical protein
MRMKELEHKGKVHRKVQTQSRIRNILHTISHPFGMTGHNARTPWKVLNKKEKRQRIERIRKGIGPRVWTENDLPRDNF